MDSHRASFAMLLALQKFPHQVKSSNSTILITNNAFCIVQRATAQSKTRIFCGYDAAEAPPVLKAACLTGCISFLFPEFGPNLFVGAERSRIVDPTSQEFLGALINGIRATCAVH
jgi:hypothetical protein